MGTRLNIKELREYLIDLYERILSGEKVTNEARKVFMDYRGSYKFTSATITDAIALLEDIGWEIPIEISRLPKPPREFAKEILNSLKKEEENPPKEWFRKVYKI
jgi:hypothetical protein